MVRSIPRVLAILVMVGLPVGAIFAHEGRLVPFLAMPLFVLGAPMVAAVARRGEEGPEETGSEDEGDGGDDGGGNRRPDRGPTTPSGPTGVLPLETSTPGGWRMRGNGRQRSTDPGRRRHPHPAPTPRPRRVPAGPHTR